LLLISFLFCFAIEAKAQDDDFPDMSYLRTDVRNSSVVARVIIRSYEEVDRIGEKSFYALYRIEGEVQEVFKGKAKKGQLLEFYYAVENGYSRSIVGDDCIVFLQNNYNEKTKKKNLGEIENSRLPTNESRLKKLRKIKAERTKKR